MKIVYKKTRILLVDTEGRIIKSCRKSKLAIEVLSTIVELSMGS